MRMHLGPPLVIAALVAVFASGAMFGIGTIATMFGRTSATIDRGKALYGQYCAACHGANLEGQTDWTSPLPNGRLPAPPHDASGHTWHHADDVLIGITLHRLAPHVGEGYESDMPAFAGVPTAQDVTAILSYIKSNWPERERAYQQRLTDQYQAKQGAGASTSQ